jgi:hypothetical protein
MSPSSMPMLNQQLEQLRDFARHIERHLAAAP